LTTRTGHVIGVSSSLSQKFAKKASILGAMAWRLHVEGETSHANVPPLKVLRAHSAGAARTKVLLVECDSRPLALALVKEGLLVAAVGHVMHDQEAANVDDSASHTDSDEAAGGSQDADGEVDGTGSQSGGQIEDRTAKALILKGEALADYLNEELVDFRMPEDLD